MTADEVAQWMAGELKRHRCLYQADVVAFVEKSKAQHLLRESASGNWALVPAVLAAFRKLTPQSAVWVRSELYWRPREPGDGESRLADG